MYQRKIVQEMGIEIIKAEVAVQPHAKQVEVDNMTMRELNEDELEKTNKGIERLDNEIIDLKESIDFNLKTIEFQKAQAEYQDYIRPYLKKKKEISDEKTMALMRQDLKSKEDIVNNLHEQVKNGVEIKNNG